MTNHPQHAAAELEQASLSDDVAAALYKAILRRDGDPAGLEAASYTISERGMREGVAVAVNDLLASQEYKDIIVHEFDYAAAFGRAATRTIGGREVAHIISLGTHCQTSSILKAYGLKTQSFPFDWLFNAPGAIVHALKDDFATFLDRQHYVSLPPYNDEPRAEHLYYLNEFGVRTFFPHRDPTTDGDYAFFERCIDRFRNVIASDDPKLFVIISRQEHDLAGQFAALHSWVKEKGNANLLAIQLLEPKGGFSLRTLRTAACGELYEFMPRSIEEGVGFPDLFDDLAVLQLITQYRIADLARSRR